ncbi:Atpase complex subunit, partial [Thalictrum thalictroides]
LKGLLTNTHIWNSSKAEVGLTNLLKRSRITNGEEFLLHPFIRTTTYRFFDFYQMGNKAAIEKERARLSDEMNRGYFADINELKKHGGKIFTGNKVIIPAAEALKFPLLQVKFPDGTSLKLPITSQDKEVEEGKHVVPGASLLCLSFRANSQAMIDSWTAPFLDAFSASNNVRIYEVSLIDSWFLSLSPIKHLLLRMMRKPKSDGPDNTHHRQNVYAFGDHYYFRKDLKILNLLTGYIFLLDNFGRIRWQGSGLATQEELSSLLSCASFLLEEK